MEWHDWIFLGIGMFFVAKSTSDLKGSAEKRNGLLFLYHLLMLFCAAVIVVSNWKL